VRVSVIVPVRDDERVFECLDSVFKAAPPGGSPQVIVVDNGSRPAFRQRLARLAERAIILDEPEPGAFAARNRGLASADGEAIFFTDADCLVRPGWLAAGVECLLDGADIAQGFSGSAGRGAAARLIQHRYGARYRRLPAGAALECDTRNLAVRAAVFDVLQFNNAYRRAGDTEFGLRAELAGFRVAYAPAMRVDHAHESRLAVFVAKQACHGWGAQRIMRTLPGARWHGRQLRIMARASRVVSSVPAGRLTGRGLIAAGVGLARLLDRNTASLPFGPAVRLLTLSEKAALLGGHLLYAPGAPEPSPSSLLGERHPRD
jgi:glycosyltransferase involved in cell wall biosynthesis